MIGTEEKSAAAFAGNLTRLREGRYLKKKELAAVLHVTPSVISQYESGRSMPGLDVLLQLADYFEVSVDYLMGRAYCEKNIEQRLSAVFYGDMTFGTLLERCERIPEGRRDVAVAVLDALRAK